MNTYIQSTGKWLIENGDTLGTGYSGRGEGKNNPLMESVKNTGPIPEGFYLIGPSFDHPQKGPLAMRLTPGDPSKTFNRDGFMIHGDSLAHAGSASEGCVIMSHIVRDYISKSKDKALRVIAA